MAIFFGRFTNTMDAKGRVSIPAKFREALGDTFYVMEGLLADRQARCLFAMGEQRYEKLADELGDPDILDVKREHYVRRFYGSTAECTLDSHGRGLITPALRKYAGLEKSILFIGVRDRVEIWEEDEYQRYQELMAEREAEMLDDVNARKAQKQS